MARYLERRLLISIPILIAVTIIMFALLQLTPGDPLDAYVSPDLPLLPAQKAALRHQLGLDRPAPIRYLYWLKETAQGNLGISAASSIPVATEIRQRIGATLILMGTAIVIGVALGILLGVISAVKQYSLLDTVLTVFAFLGISFPVYLAGLIGLYIFALVVRWFPAGGFSTPGAPFSVWDHLHHLILPASVIALQYVAATMRYTRSAMLEVLSQDYVRTARAKGLRERLVIGVHALRNALLPIVTIVGAYLPGLLSGAVFIESIFAWPGMGQLFLQSVNARDYPTIMGITLILAITILLANLLTDLAYGVVDPRIRYD